MISTLQSNKPTRTRKVPDYLVHEVLDGKPIYYKGYKAVINKTKTADEIMGCSTLQADIISYLLSVIYKYYDAKKYKVYTNEIGNHIDLGDNFSNDIAIFDKQVLTPDKINKKYASVPPKIVIEIDNEGDVSELTEIGYIYKKTKKLHDFGVESIFWVLTEIKSIIIAKPNQNWEVIDWNKDIELFDNITINIGNYLASEGIVVE
jgi:Uma2 family endonuclease